MTGPLILADELQDHSDIRVPSKNTVNSRYVGGRFCSTVDRYQTATILESPAGVSYYTVTCEVLIGSQHQCQGSRLGSFDTQRGQGGSGSTTLLFYYHICLSHSVCDHHDYYYYCCCYFYLTATTFENKGTPHFVRRSTANMQAYLMQNSRYENGMQEGLEGPFESQSHHEQHSIWSSDLNTGRL